MDFVVIVHKYSVIILRVSTKFDFFRENSVTFLKNLNLYYKGTLI